MCNGETGRTVCNMEGMKVCNGCYKECTQIDTVIESEDEETEAWRQENFCN